jgi:hypothetical protein
MDITERPREPHLLAQNPLRPPIPRLPSRRDFHQQSQPPLRQREQWQSKQETMRTPTKSPQDKTGRKNRRTGEVLNRSSERLIENRLHKERKDRMKDTQLTRFFPRTGRPLQAPQHSILEARLHHGDRTDRDPPVHGGARQQEAAAAG